jgi:hypothetical protein
MLIAGSMLGPRGCSNERSREHVRAARARGQEVGRGRQESYVCEADDALVDDGDAAENYDGAGDGTLDDGAPRGAGKAPHETGHGGGGGGDEGGRVSPLVPLFLVRRAACILGR